MFQHLNKYYLVLSNKGIFFVLIGVYFFITSAPYTKRTNPH